MVTIATAIPYVAANPYAPLHLPKITINSDGSITPQTDYITRVGSTYTLTRDMLHEYTVEILCSNIVFDGAAHIIDVTVEGNFSDQGYPAFYVDVGVNLQDVSNVVVKNLTGRGSNVNVNLQFSSRCEIVNVTCPQNIRILGDGNTITECNGGIEVYQGNNNLITKNNLTSVFVGLSSSNNKFYLNNFYLSDYPELFSSSSWDNGTVGNFWSNYTTKYPNAAEIDTSGIGNTTYAITRGWYTTRDYPNISDTDHFPLLYPYDIGKDQLGHPLANPENSSNAPGAPDSLLLGSIFAIAVIFAAILGIFNLKILRKKTVLKVAIANLGQRLTRLKDC